MSITRLVGTQAHQAARISAGVQDGSLTRPEAKQLVSNQVSTDKALVSAKRDDGVVGPKERAQIRGQQAQNSKDIFQARHNDQTQPAPTPPSSEHPRVDRQQNQAARIRDGVQDGSLTKGETSRLVKAEARTDAYLAKSKLDDGKIGPHESAVIERRQDRASAAIYAAKHNDRTQQS
ncbi:MAG TPA: hypothetical protein VFA20_28860 [Myxococcaceae bacterium]|nr:hypothetical protein [Myxococcaceae bacterium]